jgi:hypothetical protein
LFFSSSTINPQNYDGYTYGLSVRWFKDSPVIPDSSWTTLYDWSSVATGAWIYHNSTLWLISISSDWSNWITIADKNLWATTVYNSWDTVSESNCGKYYQRWNNYWFTWTWTVTTSSTQVDARDYWPWNYYSSSTFITWNSNWSSSRNDNLRWWVTWVQQRPAPIKKRYYGWKMVDDYSAMRWPCPTGFHVPTKDERAALCWVLTSTFWLASNSTTMGTYLKMPTAGLRNRSSAGVAGLGSNGYYWSSTAYSSGRTYYLYITSSSLNPQERGYRATGLSVRCFKDSSVIPDSNWTTLYQWTWSAWVFRNSSLWLISVSWGWTTWYTIQDKNLGATTVYNQWDTLSDANCGYFYQWGNNYWFPHSGTLTTSSTPVDASNYWPWNYYSSSTFIKISSSPYDWSSVQNDNLRWWVTWVQQRLAEVIKVYKWNTLIREKS